MRKIVGMTLIACILFFISCNKHTERVTITPDISVKLPVNYKMAKQVHSNREWTLYGAMLNSDEIFIGASIEKGFDTLSLEEIKERNIKNMQAYMKPYNARKFESSEKVIGEILQSDFNFEFDQKDTSFIIFARIIQQDTNFLTLSYKTMIPVSNKSINNKERFFKSMKYNH